MDVRSAAKDEGPDFDSPALVDSSSYTTYCVITVLPVACLPSDVVMVTDGV
jgi:hypothetical protein